MKHLFFDIDGTLLSHTEGIGESTVEALRLAKEKGNNIYICTGRSLAEIPETFKQFNFDGIVCAAGGYVKYKDQVLLNKLMPEHLVDNVTYHMDKLDLIYVLEGIDKSYASKKITLEREAFAQELFLKKQKTTYKYPAYDFLIPSMLPLEDYFQSRSPISKATVYAKTKDQLLELKKYIDKDFDLINYGTLAELVAKGHNKYTGIEVILNHLKAKDQEVFAFGDSINDYDMVHYADVGVAMGNASDPLKKVADYITSNVEDDGIYNALKQFNLI